MVLIVSIWEKNNLILLNSLQSKSMHTILLECNLCCSTRGCIMCVGYYVPVVFVSSTIVVKFKQRQDLKSFPPALLPPISLSLLPPLYDSSAMFLATFSPQVELQNLQYHNNLLRLRGCFSRSHGHCRLLYFSFDPDVASFQEKMLPKEH